MGKIGLIIGREFNQRVRKKSFIITTLLMPLAMVAMIAVPVLIQIYGGDNSSKEIVVIEQSQLIGSKLQSVDNITFKPINETYAEATQKYPNVYGYLVIGENLVQNTNDVKLYTTQSSTVSIENAITSQLSNIVTKIRIADTGVEGLDSLINAVRARVSMQTFDLHKSDTGEVTEKASSSGIAMAVAYASSLIIYMFILLYGMQVLQGVVEEKSNRIVEVIVSSVKPFELMLGKILGVAFVAILQFAVWVVIVGVAVAFIPGIGAGAATGAIPAEAQMLSPQLMGVLSTLTDPAFLFRILGSFLLFFVGGYLLYASMFAAIGSAVDSVADTQQLQFPVTLPLILSIFIMISVMQSPNSDAAFWFSMIPFTSPIIMMARVAYGVPAWELLLSITILYATFVGMTYVAAKIYRTGIFMYGKKPSFAEIIKWERYKG